MLKIFKKAATGLMLVLAVIFCLNTQAAKAQPGATVSIQTFYDELEPYGQWIEDPEYGYVWLPDAGPDFKPYATNGHWVVTEYGNTWVSDYDWGWAPFHYGRWRFAEDYGWEWIPGTEWGPAWVNWRTGDDYYGWAPLAPGVDIDISFGANYYEPDNYWVFAPRRYVYARNINQYYLPYGRNYSIIRNTTIINNIYSNNNRRYISGPRLDDIRRYTNSPINIYNINNIRRPGGARIRNNTLSIYRPEIGGNRNGNNPPIPNRVYSRGNVNSNGINNNPNLTNPRQPVNSGNGAVQGSNYGNANNGFGRSRGNNTNPANGNQFPQRNSNLNNTSGAQGGVGNNPSNPANNPALSGFSNQPAQNQNGQQRNSGRPETGFDYNRPRTPINQIQATNQAQQQTEQNQRNQNQQQMQQRQQEMQQRNQQQPTEQNQRNQQQMQQRQQEMQQRNQQQQTEQNQRNQQQQQERQQRTQPQQPQQQRVPPQQERQQRPTRQEVPARINNRG